MPRAVDGTRRADRRKKILKLAKGFKGRRGTNFKAAKDAVTKVSTTLTLAARTKKASTAHCGSPVSTPRFATKVCLTRALSTA